MGFIYFVSLTACSSVPAGLANSEPIVLSDENLIRLKTHPFTKSMEAAFRTATPHRKKCPKCKELFPEADRYQFLLGKPFMVVEAKAHDFGGYFVLIVFEKHPRVYRLWVYEIDQGSFQVREMAPWGVKLNKRMLDEFTDDSYDRYWVAAK